MRAAVTAVGRRLEPIAFERGNFALVGFAHPVDLIGTVSHDDSPLPNDPTLSTRRMVLDRGALLVSGRLCGSA
jgi:hypothetical protein